MKCRKLNPNVKIMKCYSCSVDTETKLVRLEYHTQIQHALRKGIHYLIDTSHKTNEDCFPSSDPLYLSTQKWPKPELPISDLRGRSWNG